MHEIDLADPTVPADAAGFQRGSGVEPNLQHGEDTNTQHLPIARLFVLAICGFVTILTEALPAGLLPQMSGSLGVSEALIGQCVTAYALGSLLAAIPVTVVTRRWRRRPLLMLALVGFVVANSVTAVFTHFPMILVARFAAGVSAGVIWALLAGYAARLAPLHLRGRAIAVAMVGTPLALSIGIPLGTWLGASFGWRLTFGGLSALALLLTVCVRALLPDLAGQPASASGGLIATLHMPGVKAVLAATFFYVLAHNVLYTYIAPFVALSDGTLRVDAELFVFGAVALVGIGVVGLTIDLRLRVLLIGSTVLFLIALAVMGIAARHGAAVTTGIAIWGFAFGGIATVFQTASAKAAGPRADIAQSLIVTVWNLAIAGGGALGAATIALAGTSMLPWSAMACLLISLAVVFRRSRCGVAI